MLLARRRGDVNVAGDVLPMDSDPGLGRVILVVGVDIVAAVIDVALALLQNRVAHRNGDGLGQVVLVVVIARFLGLEREHVIVCRDIAVRAVGAEGDQVAAVLKRDAAKLDVLELKGGGKVGVDRGGLCDRQRIDRAHHRGVRILVKRANARVNVKGGGLGNVDGCGVLAGVDQP